MSYNIRVQIAGKNYNLRATSETEGEIRLAVAEVNKKITDYLGTFLGHPLEDILTFALLNECISKRDLQQKIGLQKAEVDKVAGEIENYLAQED